MKEMARFLPNRRRKDIKWRYFISKITNFARGFRSVNFDLANVRISSGHVVRENCDLQKTAIHQGLPSINQTNYELKKKTSENARRTKSEPFFCELNIKPALRMFGESELLHLQKIIRGCAATKGQFFGRVTLVHFIIHEEAHALRKEFRGKGSTIFETGIPRSSFDEGIAR